MVNIIPVQQVTLSIQACISFPPETQDLTTNSDFQRGARMTLGETIYNDKVLLTYYCCIIFGAVKQ